MVDGGEGLGLLASKHAAPARAEAVRSFANAQATGELHHDADPRYVRHVGNCHRRELYGKDEEGRPLWVVYKERQGSPNKIDLAVAGVLSWEARRAALAEGASGGPSVYDQRAGAGGELIDAW